MAVSLRQRIHHPFQRQRSWRPGGAVASSVIILVILLSFQLPQIQELEGWRTTTTTMMMMTAAPLTFFSSEAIYTNDNDNNNNDKNKKNTTLMIVMGNLRCGEPAWTTLKQNVLDANHADLALMLGDISPAYQNSSLFDRATYIWRFDEHDDWGDALDDLQDQQRMRTRRTNTTTAGAAVEEDLSLIQPVLPSWRDTVLPRLTLQSIAFGGVYTPVYKKRIPGGGAPQYVARSLIQDRIRALDLTKQYDRFVIGRSDSYYKFVVNLTEMDDKFVWVPDGSDFGGLNDRHMIASRQHILTVLDGFSALLRGDGRNYTDEDLHLNPETFLLNSLRRGGIQEDDIQRFPQPFYTCVADGDQKSWGAKMIMGEDGVYAKKKREYYPVIGRCRRNRRLCDQGKIK